jgi:hypothetical protein
MLLPVFQRCLSRVGLLASAGLCAALVLGVAAPAMASMALALDATALAKNADRVVVAEVLSVATAWDAGRTTILSTIELQVEETLKAPRDQKKVRRLSIVQVGGTLDGIVMQVPGQASFEKGERAVFFLKGDARESRVVGLGQGKRPLRFDAAARAWMVEPGDRSAAVQMDREGRFQPAGPDQALPLDVLRAQLRARQRR